MIRTTPTQASAVLTFQRETHWVFQLLVLNFSGGSQGTQSKDTPFLSLPSQLPGDPNLWAGTAEGFCGPRGQGWEGGQRTEAQDQEEKRGLGMWHTDICAYREISQDWGYRLLKWGTAAVPNLPGIRDQFHGTQSSHRPEQGRMVWGRFKRITFTMCVISIITLWYIMKCWS